MPWTGGLIAFGAVLAGVPLVRRRKRVAAVLLTALALSTLGFLMSCGGGSGGGTTSPASPRNYTVTITGSGNISSGINVTVQ
jgi:multidrug efflux pump subunit AcrA (membrane-fusion protein)